MAIVIFQTLPRHSAPPFPIFFNYAWRLRDTPFQRVKENNAIASAVPHGPCPRNPGKCSSSRAWVFRGGVRTQNKPFSASPNFKLFNVFSLRPYLRSYLQLILVLFEYIILPALRLPAFFQNNVRSLPTTVCYFYLRLLACIDLFRRTRSMRQI